MGSLNILHIGYGSTLSYSGGIITYTEDLCSQLYAAGHRVSYLYTGDHTFGFRTRLQSSWQSGVEHIQIINSPNLYYNFGNPLTEIKNSVIESIFGSLIRKKKPDIVHVQNIVGLPSSIIEIASGLNIPIVVTHNNYTFICPRGDLFLADGTICDGPGINCAYCVGSSSYIASTLKPRLWSLVRNMPGEKAIVQLYRQLKHKFNNQAKLNFGKHRELEKAFPFIRTGISESTICGYSLREQYNRYILQKEVDLNIAVSRCVFEQLEKFSVTSDKIKLMHIGSKVVESIKYIPKSTNNDKFVFGYIGPLHYVKGNHVLARAFSCLGDDKVKLIIYGETSSASYMRTLKSICSGLDVEFRGRYKPNQLSEILGQFDAVVVPPIWLDNGPQVVFEALASKTPVIGSRIGGIPDFVKHGVNGLLFEAGNIEDMKNKMKSVVDNPDLLKSFRKKIKAMKTMLEHSKEMESLYYDVIDRKKRSINSPGI